MLPLNPLSNGPSSFVFPFYSLSLSLSLCLSLSFSLFFFLIVHHWTLRRCCGKSVRCHCVPLSSCGSVKTLGEGKNPLLMLELSCLFAFLMCYDRWSVAQSKSYKNTNCVKTHFLFFVGVPLANANVNAYATNIVVAVGQGGIVLDLHSSSVLRSPMAPHLRHHRSKRLKHWTSWMNHCRHLNQCRPLPQSILHHGSPASPRQQASLCLLQRWCIQSSVSLRPLIAW